MTKCTLKGKLKNKNFKYYQRNLNNGFSFKKKFDVLMFDDVLDHLEYANMIFVKNV